MSKLLMHCTQYGVQRTTDAHMRVAFGIFRARGTLLMQQRRLALILYTAPSVQLAPAAPAAAARAFG